MELSRWTAVILLTPLLCACAQAPAARETGAVTAIDTSTKTITLRTDSGGAAAVRYDDATSIRRVAAGAKDLAGATVITSSEIVPGDRVVARGVHDGTSLTARSIIVMAGAEVARKQAADRAEWDRRGIGGIVTTVNPQANEIAIRVPGPVQSAPVTIALAPGARIRRYAPDSVKFSDAKPSRLDDIQPGDQVRALGTRSPEGARYTAEELVSGAFSNIAATVDAADGAANTLRVTDLATKKKVVVLLTQDSMVRRLPPFAANMLAGRLGEHPSGHAGPAEPPTGAPARREGGPPFAPPGTAGPGEQMSQRPRDLQSMLERMPPIPLSELKPGDALIIASTRGADASRVTAINILAGVEPLLRAPQNGGVAAAGTWNLDLNMNMSLP